MTSPEGSQNTTRDASRHLVLVGAGGVHIQLLQALARSGTPDLRVTLISPEAVYWHVPRVPDWLMGNFTSDDLAFSLEPLLKSCNGTHVAKSIQYLDVAKQALIFPDNTRLSYDALSIEVGANCDNHATEQVLPGSIDYGMWIQPLKRFTSLWPQVADIARHQSLRLSVVGDGQIATALALGLQQALMADPLAKPFRITLISGGPQPLAHSPPRMQERVLELLKARQITVLQDRCTELAQGEATLGCGARLASDVTMVALLAPYPSWVLHSQLAKSGNGVDVDPQGQSTSHARVFFTKYQPINTAAPAGQDLAWRLCHFLDLPPTPNILAPTDDTATWLFLPSGIKKALGYWGNVCMSGSSVWHVMQSADARALRRAGLVVR